MSHYQTRFKLWIGSVGPLLFTPKDGEAPFRYQSSRSDGTFTSGRPVRNVARASTETRDSDAEENLTQQGEISNGGYSNYRAAHYWSFQTQSVTPA